MALKQKMDNGGEKPCVRELNSVLNCTLCNGYFIDAVTLTECLHTFCRSCILKYHEENSKTQCPECPNDKKKVQSFRSDHQIQALVYKLVPSLYVKEMQRREEFYRSTGVRSGSSCSEDSVLDRERDGLIENEAERMISKCLGDRNQYLSPDDSISLSLEYYQSSLDKTDVKKERRLAFLTCKQLKHSSKERNNSEKTETVSNSSSNRQSEKENGVKISENNVNNIVKNNGQVVSSSDKNSLDNLNITNEHKLSENAEKTDKNNYSLPKICDKRYLQCPAAVNMRHLQKFVRMKFGLTGDHRVDIIYKGEVLPTDFSLMDVAYTFKWERIKPMRFFYRIFTPMRKISPIKIVTKASSTGGKQLQVVPLSTSTNTEPKSEKIAERTERTSTEKIPEKKEVKILPREETEKEKLDKERLFANLQLQSTAKAKCSPETKKPSIPNQKLIKDYIFEYEHQSPDEIKKFAEKRDREWALQKKLEEDNRDDYHVIKKRKKSKHSKNDSTSYKKRKIHAEITSHEKDDLKVKLKISSNGHKHKHHKVLDGADKTELSSKEKLLQLRQVRPKHLSQSGSGDEKPQPAALTLKIPKTEVKLPKTEAKLQEQPKEQVKTTFVGQTKPHPTIKTNERNLKPSVVVTENNNKPLESHVKPKVEQIKQRINSQSTPRANSNHLNAQAHSIHRSEPPNKVSRKDFVPRTNSSPFTAQKTFPKVSQTLPKTVDSQKVIPSPPKLSTKPFSVNSIGPNKTLDKKIASLQQRCTIEPKTLQNNVAQEKKVTFAPEKSRILTPQYPPGFTVSKIEQGVKRKAEDTIEDKGKGLEIFLINPQRPAEIKSPGAKRPIPGAIPVKNAVNLKSGVSITPKLPERKEVSAPLDLSKAPRPSEQFAKALNKQEPLNGINRQLSNLTQRPMGSPGRNTPENKGSNHQISNLHLLSKVATEHLSKNPQNILTSKPRPQIPNLQNIRVPIGQPGIKTPQMQRLPPKLNEIQKFRPSTPQFRSMRPPNQNIRNIPNPSLLINRQQQRLTNPVSSSTQNSTHSITNHLNINSTANNVEKSMAEASKTQANFVSTTSSKEVSAVKCAAIEQKSEKKEISV